MTNDKSDSNDASTEPQVISGTARNAKAGAVLVDDDGSPTYVEGLSEWPEHLFNKRLKLTGIVERKGFYPQAQQHADGEMQGMVGVPRVIRLTEPLPEAD
jgi:hypothetical protein